MCGIVGATCERNVYKILIEGLNRLEYRGYDSAGLKSADIPSLMKDLSMNIAGSYQDSNQGNNMLFFLYDKVVGDHYGS